MSVLHKSGNFNYFLTDPGQTAGVNSRYASNFFHSFQVSCIVNADGTGTHSTLQEAVTSLGTGGGVIHVKSDLETTSSITISASTHNLTIKGLNFQVLENTGSFGSSIGFDIETGCTDIRIEGLELKDWETVFNAADATVDRVWVSNCYLNNYTTIHNFSANYVYDASNID